MCEFFSAIVFKSGDIRFCESDSHETLIERLHLDDSASIYLRPWVRVECTGDEHDDVRIDEEYCPSWVDADRDEINERVVRTRARLLPLYEARQNMSRLLDEKFTKAYTAIENRYDDVYEADGAALAEWPNSENPADGNAHDAVLTAARELCRRETDLWRQQRDKEIDLPRQVYVASMSKFFGYVPERTPPAKPVGQICDDAEV